MYELLSKHEVAAEDKKQDIIFPQAVFWVTFGPRVIGTDASALVFALKMMRWETNSGAGGAADFLIFLLYIFFNLNIFICTNVEGLILVAVVW